MAKRNKIQEKQVLTEWQKRNLEFLRKKESEDSEGVEKENSNRKQGTGKEEG
ncbi:MAG: hypothetical protein ACLTZN_08310 [Streptococcus sp.]